MSKDHINLEEYLDIPFTFRERPQPLKPESRLVWGLIVLLLILRIASRAKRSSISRLHILSWSIRNKKNLIAMNDFLERNQRLSSGVLVNYDPAFSKAINYAIAECLVEVQNNARLKLSSSGEILANEILDVQDSFIEEKEFLYSKGSILNEKKVKELLG